MLVVDDSPAVRELCVFMLRSLKHEALEAGSAEEALEVYASERPDAVFLDVDMPGTGGLAALAALRQLDPGARVAMLTGDRRTPVVQRALAGGARDYVVKPFSSARLAEALRRMLS